MVYLKKHVDLEHTQGLFRTLIREFGLPQESFKTPVHDFNSLESRFTVYSRLSISLESSSSRLGLLEKRIKLENPC